MFAGSSSGRQTGYLEQARRLGEVIANRGYGLVYGGASVGLMNQVADAVLAKRGRVIGILPAWLDDREVAHDGLTELRIVSSMHERVPRSHGARTVSQAGTP